MNNSAATTSGPHGPQAGPGPPPSPACGQVSLAPLRLPAEAAWGRREGAPAGATTRPRASCSAADGCPLLSRPGEVAPPPASQLAESAGFASARAGPASRQPGVPGGLQRARLEPRPVAAPEGVAGSARAAAPARRDGAAGLFEVS